MTWLVGNEVFDPTEEELRPFLGFVYIIRHKDSGRAYIGQKKFWFSKARKVKGKTKRIRVQSDWRDYWGSNQTLQKEVEELGPEAFRRDIISLCPTKGIMNYMELYHQMVNNVLIRPDEYYNDYIGGRINRKHLTPMIKSK